MLMNIESIRDPLNHSKHARYFKRFLELLPPKLSSHDSTRMTIAFFAVCGLDVLNSLELLKPQMINDIINWIYMNQIVPEDDSSIQCGGFEGSTTLRAKNRSSPCIYNWGHVAITYTGIAALATLGDNLSRIDRKAILKGLGAIQKEDGSFSATIEGNENDMRFVYCAAAVCAMLDDWSYIDKEKMANYIISSIRYDYGISQDFESESHGGTTYCAIAALNLSGQLHLLEPDVIEGIKRWLLFRQMDGFNGRPNKPIDTCYSFWIGASLKILNAFDLSDYPSNREYIISTQDFLGGFSKWPNFNTDPFHTYFGICGLSLLGEEGLLEVNPSLNISVRAYEHLKRIHESWRKERQTEVKIV